MTRDENVIEALRQIDFVEKSTSEFVRRFNRMPDDFEVGAFYVCRDVILGEKP